MFYYLIPTHAPKHWHKTFRAHHKIFVSTVKVAIAPRAVDWTRRTSPTLTLYTKSHLPLVTTRPTNISWFVHNISRARAALGVGSVTPCIIIRVARSHHLATTYWNLLNLGNRHKISNRYWDVSWHFCGYSLCISVIIATPWGWVCTILRWISWYLWNCRFYIYVVMGNRSNCNGIEHLGFTVNGVFKIDICRH